MKTKLPIKLRSKKEDREEARMHQQIQNPQKLKLLVLSGSRLASNDFSFMLRCKSLIKLDLSDNQLSSIPQFFKLSQFSYLKLIYLHKNNFKRLQDIRPVLQCQRLVHITLHDNPIYSSQLEHFLINIMKTLKMVNQRVVYQQERFNSVVANHIHIKVNIDQLGVLSQQNNGQQDVSKFIQALDKQLDQIDKLWVNFNPLVKFQRIWRDRRLYLKTKPTTIYHKQIKVQQQIIDNSSLQLLNKYFILWKTFKYGRKNVEQILIEGEKNYLMYGQQNYLVAKRNIKVSHIVKGFVDYIRNKIKKRKSVKVFQKHLALKVLMFHSSDSFYYFSDINQTHRIIIASNQQPLMENILSHVSQILGRQNNPYSFRQCQDYLSIRTVDSYRVESQKSMYRMFLQPSMRCIFLNKKISLVNKTPLVKIKQLSYIIKNNTRISTKQLLKMNMLYSQLLRYSNNQYENCLVQFECLDKEYFEMFLRIVYYFNCKCISLQMKKSDIPSGFNFLNTFSDQLVFYFDKQLKRTTSAVMIQKTWRRYCASKSSLSLIQIIRKKRAALLIQYFYRSLEFNHRCNLNILIFQLLKEFTQNKMLIQQQIYFKITTLPVFKQISHELCLFYNHQTIKITNKYKKSPFNPNITEQFENFQQKGQWSKGDNYHLLHVNSKTSRVNLNGRKYLQFQYKSLKQVKKRVALLAMLTYRFQQNGVFIKGLSKNMIISDLKQYQEKVQRIYSISFNQSIDKDQIKFIKNQEPIFLFPSSNVNYFEQSRQPIKSFLKFPLRLYCYVDFDEQPAKKDEKLIISFQHFKQKQKQLIRDVAQSFIEATQNPITNARTSQKLKRLNQTLKNLTSDPLTVTKNIEEINTTQNKQQNLLKKKQQVSQIRQNRKQNKLINNQYKKLEIGKVKKWRENIKDQIKQSKYSKEQEQQNKRDKIRSSSWSMREKKNSLQQKREHETQFVQKGNFLFKQYMKISVMKERMTQIQKKRNSIPRKTERTLSQTKIPYDFNQASLSFRRNKLFIKQEQSPTFKSNQQTPRYYEQPTDRQVIQHCSKTELLVQKPRIKKTKQHMVHGVFPEQFFAIEKKKTGINLPII